MWSPAGKAPRHPSYLKLAAEGELHERVLKAYDLLSSCTLCPRLCRVNRLEGTHGYCRAGADLRISSFGPHFGEEPPLVGRFGSGTVFFSFCTLGCIFCQNYEISHYARGEDMGCARLADMMLDLQGMGCHNINLVTPTHYVPQILRAVEIAAGSGLRLPLVYNTGGYDRVETLRLLEDVIDIYMPDAKYGRDDVAFALSGARGYVAAMKDSIREMHRQVGDLRIEKGIASRGLIVRHLVLPEGLAGTEVIMDFLASEISPGTYVNIMEQYRPAGSVFCEDGPPMARALRRPITGEEFDDARRIALKKGLHRGFAPL